MTLVEIASPASTDRWDLQRVLLVPKDSLKNYFATLKQIPLLTKEEETRLGRAILRGDQDAAAVLSVHNLRYAAHLARSWEHQLFPSTEVEAVWSLSDGVQAANVGLWTAALRFDPDQARFTTYATWWIRQSWLRARNSFRWAIRLPVHASDECIRYFQALATFSDQSSVEPTAESLAAYLEWPVERVRFWQHWAATQSLLESLDEYLPDSTTTRHELLETPRDVFAALENQWRRGAVRELLQHLKPRDAQVLRLRFGLDGAPMTLEEIGLILHVTRERVRQIERNALRSLRQWVDRHPDENWRGWLTA